MTDDWSSSEIESVLADACYDEHRDVRPTSDAVARLLALLDDAEQAHRPWAQILRQRLLADGARAACTAFVRRDKRLLVPITKPDGRTAIVSKAAARRLPRVERDETGKIVRRWFQPMLFDEMTAADVAQWVAMESAAAAQRAENAEQVGGILLALLRRHLGSTVLQAVQVEGYESTQAYLLELAAA
jgi:hypothetical protein